MATAKHFIGDGATEYGVEGGVTTLSETEIEEHLLPPYRTAVASGVGAVMASFNIYEGIPMHAHKRLITGVLKEQMQFDGIMLSDWKGYSKFGEADIINAGIDMVMAVDGDLELFQKGLKKAVEEGHVSRERIDDAVRRILRQKFRLGLFENPYPVGHFYRFDRFSAAPGRGAPGRAGVFGFTQKRKEPATPDSGGWEDCRGWGPCQ